MNSFIKSGIAKKIIILLIIILLFNFTISTKVYAANLVEWGASSLLKEIMQLVSSIGDVIMGLFNNVMLGADGVGSAMLSVENENLQPNSGSWLTDNLDSNSEQQKVYKFSDGEIDTRSFSSWSGLGHAFAVPNMLYSPENIFGNNIAAFDINFLRDANKKSYTTITGEEATTWNEEEGKYENEPASDAQKSAVPASSKLRQTIASWYRAFRNISVVALLSVLVYLGIRIIISSAASDKAKYKEHLKDWFVALCLVFVIHFIMSGILMITDKVTDLFSTTVASNMRIEAYDDGNLVKFNTNLIGLTRFRAQSSKWQDTTAYTIIYIVLVIYTIIFTFLYFKRFLYIAFLTMIAPLVSLTYPMDKAGDGKSQAFDMWFKEYTMNVIIQPVHLILYSVFVATATSLAAENPIYALIAIGFLIPAEKFIKAMFGLDKGKTASGFGSFAGGAMVMKGLNKLSSLGKNSSGGKSLSSGSSGNDGSNNGVHIPVNPNAGNLDSLRGNLQSGNQGNVGGGQPPRITSDNRQRLGSSPEAGATPRPSSQTQSIMDRFNRNRTQGNTQNGREAKFIAKAAGKTAIRGAKSLGAGVWKNKKKIAGKVARMGAKGAGAVFGGTIGLSAGIATGDAKNAFTYMAGGTFAGSTLGNKLFNVGESGEKKTIETGGKIRDAYNEERYGIQEARNIKQEREMKKAKKAFMKDPKERQKYDDMRKELNYEGSLNDFMSAVSDYKEAGVEDDKVIKNGLKTERDFGGGIGGNLHNQLTDVAGYMAKNDLGKNTFVEDKKFKEFEGLVASTGLSENQQEQLKVRTAQLAGQENMYERRKQRGLSAAEQERRNREAAAEEERRSRNRENVANHRDRVRRKSANSQNTSRPNRRFGSSRRNNNN